jgi:hypothetical protein
MTTVHDVRPPAPLPVPAFPEAANDHRGSPIPTLGMIATRLMELRKRRGLMVALVVVNIGLPSIFLIVRLMGHAIAPKSYGPAGGYDIFTNLVCGVMFTFGFIVAAALGCTAGSVDLTDGMFRHLVVTGRSRLALYLARIPAGLAIVVPLVAIGFAIVCSVCVFAAPTSISYDGTSVPANLSQSGLEQWAGNHADSVICNFPYNGNITANVRCPGQGPGPGPGSGIIVQKGGGTVNAAPPLTSPAQNRAQAMQIAREDFSDYKSYFLYPSTSLMVGAGLWLELEATIGFIVGLGLASLMGQRTVPIVLMFILEVVLTPIIAVHVIPHLLNVQRGLVGLATAHLEPAGLPLPLGFGGGGGGGPNGPGASRLIPESTTVAICVIVAWLVVWTALGAWRMMRRDA